MKTEPGEDTAPERSDPLPKPLQSLEGLHDPFDWYERKRSAAPVHYDPHRDVYDVFSYDLVRRSLQDNDRLVRKPLARDHGDTTSPFSYLDSAMVWSDGESHRQSKRELFEYFRPDRLAGLQATIREITDDQLDVALRGGPAFDFVEEFAVPVPLRVIMSMVGIPQADHRQVLGWLNTFREVMNSEFSAKESYNEARMAEPVAYFRDLLAEKRADPDDDLASRLVAETDLDPATIGANCFDFILAGQGTMSEFLSNALFLFDRNGLVDQYHEYDLEAVLEEVLRVRSPLQSRARETAQPVSIGDTSIPAGETVILWIGAANRDPAQYERPDAFLPERNPEHLAFGNGPHTCIGAPLARMQAPIVLQAFLSRVDGVDIDTDSLEPKRKASKLGFERMRVVTEPA